MQPGLSPCAQIACGLRTKNAEKPIDNYSFSVIINHAFAGVLESADRQA